MDYITVTDKEIRNLVEEVLGFGSHINLGPTGRQNFVTFFGRESTLVPELAEWEIDEVAQRAGVLSDDDFAQAAVDGIYRWLTDNKADIQAKINAAVDEMHRELLATPADGN